MINMPGGPEMMVIILVALLVLGPQQLPKAMRTFGNMMAEIRKISTGFQAEMKSAMDSITDEPTKPHSGSMADATPAPATDPDVIEVVARNPEDPSAAPEPAVSAASEPVADDGPSRPAIDPVDRAAG